MLATTHMPVPARLTPLAARRLLAALLLAATIAAIAMVAAAGAHRARSGSVSLDGAGPGVALNIRPISTRVHIVQPGETLWTIARSFQPTGDIRPLVAEMARTTGSEMLQPGQRVVVPG